jgi:hypothetical protein
MLPRAERIELNVRVLFESMTRHGFTGTTVDVSDSGLYFIVRYRAEQLGVGSLGTLSLLPRGSVPSRRCRVTRVTDDGVAVTYLDGPGLTLSLRSSSPA